MAFLKVSHRTNRYPRNLDPESLLARDVAFLKGFSYEKETGKYSGYARPVTKVAGYNFLALNEEIRQ